MKRAILVLVVFMTTCAGGRAFAASAGRFTEVEGEVYINRAGGGRVLASLDAEVFQGDELESSRGSKATVLFKDDSVLRLGPSTRIEINKMVYDEDSGVVQAAYDLAVGTVMSVVGGLFGGDKSSYEIKTDTATSGVRGTMFIVKAGVHPNTGNMTTMMVGIEGAANFCGQSGGGCYDVGSGQYSVAELGRAATPPSTMSQADLEALINTVHVSRRSLDTRASELRNQSAGQAPDPDDDELTPPAPGGDGDDEGEDEGEGEGDGDEGAPGDTDPDDLPSEQDNPENIIFQEPPPRTELKIIIQESM